MQLLNRLRPEDKEQAKQLSKAISDLAHTPGWGLFRKAAEALILAMTPNVTDIADQDMQSFVASRMCYVQGVKDCLAIVDEQSALYNKLKKER